MIILLHNVEKDPMCDEKKGSSKTLYDTNAIAALAGLEPVRARGPTIINGAELSENELEKMGRILADNGSIWQVEVTDKRGRTTKMFRDA